LLAGAAGLLARLPGLIAQRIVHAAQGGDATGQLVAHGPQLAGAEQSTRLARPRGRRRERLDSRELALELLDLRAQPAPELALVARRSRGARRLRRRIRVRGFRGRALGARGPGDEQGGGEVTRVDAGAASVLD